MFALSKVLKCRGGVILASGGCHQHPELEATEEQMVKTISDATKISLETTVKLNKLDQGNVFLVSK